MINHPQGNIRFSLKTFFRDARRIDEGPIDSMQLTIPPNSTFRYFCRIDEPFIDSMDFTASSSLPLSSLHRSDGLLCRLDGSVKSLLSLPSCIGSTPTHLGLLRKSHDSHHAPCIAQ